MWTTNNKFCISKHPSRESSVSVRALRRPPRKSLQSASQHEQHSAGTAATGQPFGALSQLFPRPKRSWKEARRCPYGEKESQHQKGEGPWEDTEGKKRKHRTTAPSRLRPGSALGEINEAKSTTEGYLLSPPLGPGAPGAQKEMLFSSMHVQSKKPYHVMQYYRFLSKRPPWSSSHLINCTLAGSYFRCLQDKK